VARFRACVAGRLGLAIEDTRLGTLAEILSRRSARARGGVDGYLTKLESSAELGEEVKLLALELTIGETYFFRNAEQLRAFSALPLPQCSPHSAARGLRILSAGCASGEEPYSLAIVLREQPRIAAGAEVSILGIDVNASALERAARGSYSAWALRETDAATRARWFRRDGETFSLIESVRAMVCFQERNLAEENFALWQPEAFDVVFCRNVLMYFTPDAARAAVSRIARSLVPGGYLFLGHAETLRGLSQDFHLCHTHDTFYYRRRAASEAARLVDARGTREQNPARPAPSWTPPVASVAPLLDAGSWVETIRVSSERIQSLAEAPRSGSRAAGPGESTSPAELGELRQLPVWSVALIVELLRQERFADAKQLLSTLPPEAARDPDVLLLRAVLFTHGGDLTLAESLCRELLALDETSAGARYLMALCREHVGDVRGATEHDQIAVYLDPSFAMPRLHLGLLARRTGDPDQARSELMQALALLEREDSSRLLLFGGGFGREALIALCRAELVRCGGEP
jgi:chemotaxis protein methyltransferase CheR